MLGGCGLKPCLPDGTARCLGRRFLRGAGLALMAFGIALFANTESRAGFLEGYQAFQAEDYETALVELEAAADADDKRALFLLGVMHQEGLGVEPDLERTVELWTLAAEPPGADVFAQFNLAVLYEGGDGVERDVDRAIALYRLAADRGMAAAMLNLGVLYAQGTSVDTDREAALRWFYQASEAGNETAERYFASLSGTAGQEPPFAGSWQVIDFASSPDRLAWSRYGEQLDALLGARLRLGRSAFRLGRGVCGRPVFVAGTISSSALFRMSTGATGALVPLEPGASADLSHVDVVCGGSPQASIARISDTRLIAAYADGYAVLAPVPSDLVARAQQGLTDLGFEPGPVDGVYGPRTTAAVRAFRETAGLRTNGAISDGLIRTLDRALATAAASEASEG